MDNIVTFSPKLKILDIPENALSEASADNLDDANLTTDQCQHLMDVTRTAKEKTHNVSRNDYRKWLPAVVVSIKKDGLYDANLTPN